MNRAALAASALLVLAAGCGKKKEADPLETLGKLIGSEEQVVIGQIRSAATPEEREKSDPFRDLDGPFYDAVNEEGRDFDTLADRWLTEVCGIKDLRTPPPAAEAGNGG